MASVAKDIKKLAQAYLREQGFYSGDIDGIWGTLSKKAFKRYSDHLKALGVDIGGESPLLEDGGVESLSGVVVIDPGHGGKRKIGGSSPNNATSASGVLEKSMTLDLAKRIKQQLLAMGGTQLSVHLTRSGDSNLSLSDRAQWAADKQADVFLSLHFNGFNGSARGTETWILSEDFGNVNVAADRGLALRVQSAMFSAIQQLDPGARDRGVKDNKRLGVLNDIYLGNTRGEANTRACLAEVEFIDNPDVDALLNTSDTASQSKDAIARAIAEGIVEDLRANA